MSKISEAKEAQGYEPKPVFPMCSNCINLKSDIEEIKTYGQVYKKETNIRCGIGGFAVKKQGTCELHKPALHPGN